jgi:hypothetical protein
MEGCDPMNDTDITTERCGAQTRSGEPCKLPGHGAGGRCRLHGGASLTGTAHPRFKTGRQSRYLPKRLLAVYQKSLADPDLLELRSELALIDARLSDLLRRVDLGEAGTLWRQFMDLFRDLQDAIRAKDVEGTSTALLELERIINRGNADQATWDEILKIVGERRKLTDTERKRLVDMQQYITHERAMVLISALLDSVKRHIHDRHTLAAISAEFLRITGLPAGEQRAQQLEQPKD